MAKLSYPESALFGGLFADSLYAHEPVNSAGFIDKK